MFTPLRIFASLGLRQFCCKVTTRPLLGSGKMNSLRLLFLCSALLAFAPTAFSADIFRLWHGVGIQGAQGEWSTEVDLRKTVPTVIYPSLKCGGVWQPLGVQNGVHEFREVIDVGRDICIDGYVRVYLLNKKRMAIEYYQFKGDAEIAKSVVFPGPHHEDTKNYMIGVTRKFIAKAKK
jgi:hypothetical protein